MTSGPVGTAVSDADFIAIPRFLHRETALLDRREFLAWLDLVTDDVGYLITMQVTRLAEAGAERYAIVDDDGEPSRTDHVTSGESHRGRLEHDVHRRRQSHHAAHFENAKSRRGHQLALVCTKARTTSASG